MFQNPVGDLHLSSIKSTGKFLLCFAGKLNNEDEKGQLMCHFGSVSVNWPVQIQAKFELSLLISLFVSLSQKAKSLTGENSRKAAGKHDMESACDDNDNGWSSCDVVI